MPNTIRSPVDTILGEAVYGTPQERFADMLGIASVISNRATLGNVSPEDVVSAPGQFDAYGKSFPAGAEQYRGLAEQAWNQVNTIGPVTGATYYSTPEAAKNLPGGLQPVDQTTGHVYQVDPQNRAFRTAKGFVQPAAELVATVAQKASQTARGLATGAIKAVGNTIEAVGDATATTGRGLAALAPNGLRSPNLSFDLGAAQRNQVPSSGIHNKVAGIVDSVVPGARTNLYSGMEPAGAAPVGSPNRHPRGYAGDFNFYDPSGAAITDPVAMQDIAMGMAAKYGANVGFGPEYMGRANMHIDTMPTGPGGFPGGQQWGSTAKSWADNLNFARETGIGPTPYSNAPTPFERDQQNPNSLAPSAENTPESFAAPVGRVERASLSPAAPGPSGVIDNMKAGMESPMYGPGQVAPASQPSPVRPDNMMAAGPKGTFNVDAPKTQTPADLAAAYGQMATMADVGIANLSGAPLAAPQQPSLEQVASAALPSAPQTIAAPQKKAQPQQTIGPFPAAPTLKATPKKGKLAQRAAAAAVGGLLGGLPGAAIGGLLGPAAMRAGNPFGALGGLFGGTPNPSRSNYGTGLAAISDLLGGGGTAGATAYSRSTPGYSVTNLGNGWIEKQNQYGVKSYEHTGFTGSLFGEGGLFGGRDRAGGRGLSDKASADIDAGRGGLF